MNNISFTGINNIYTGKKFYSRVGGYVTSDGEIKHGTKNYKEILIKCKLTDDSKGNDYTEFKQALSKSAGSYQAKCIKDCSNDYLTFLVRRCEVDDIAENISNSNFVLNGVQILPNDRRILPIFSYLAKLTRKIADNPDTSEQRYFLLKTANKSIHEEAVNFIENMV